MPPSWPGAPGLSNPVRGNPEPGILGPSSARPTPGRRTGREDGPMVRMMLRGTLVRWRRLLLSGAAVALGVMFVSGALVFNAPLADGSAQGVPQPPDLTVTAPGGVPGDLVDRVRAVPGVHGAEGVVAADGARL